MATLTYDSTPADQPEFNEAEQEALAIGEQAEAEQQQLLAGKFRDTEALEQAYLELQTKLGEPRDEEKPAEETPEEAEPEEEQEDEKEPTMTAEDAEYLQSIVGGEEAYNNMLKWAGSNLNKQEIAMYDKVMSSGNAYSCFFAVQALAGRYEQAVGNDGQMLTGRGANESPDVFRSQAEVVQAMQDRRYDNDPAFRQDVFNKLERSNLQY